MKKLFFKLMVVGFAVSLFTSCKKDYYPDISPIGPEKIDSSLKYDPRPDIDLAAEAINFSVVKPMDKYHAVIQVEGIVRNVGRLNYASGAGGQSIQLWQDNGSGKPTLVAEHPFQNLDVNATLSVSFALDWDKSVEFPPSYSLYISYNPDYLLDSNPNNDDAVYANNSLERTGSAINELPFL